MATAVLLWIRCVFGDSVRWVRSSPLFHHRSLTITGLTALPNNRVHREFCYGLLCGWLPDTFDSFCHCHLRCLALIKCKYRCIFPKLRKCSFSFKCSYRPQNTERKQVKLLEYIIDSSATCSVIRLMGCRRTVFLFLVKLNLAAVSEDIFRCQAAGVGTADPAAEAHSLASN